MHKGVIPYNLLLTTGVTLIITLVWLVSKYAIGFQIQQKGKEQVCMKTVQRPRMSVSVLN